MKVNVRWPRSLAARICLTLSMVILVAELLAGVIWFQSSDQRQQDSLVNTIESLADSAAASIGYFKSLPINYRHLVLEQIRQFGGTRFFVSLNNRPLPVLGLEASQRKELLLDKALKIVRRRAGEGEVRLDFSKRQDLKVFNSAISIDKLPALWSGYNLASGDLDLPIMVVQVELSEKEWFYLAAVLPIPENSFTPEFIDRKQLLFVGLSVVMLVVVTWLLIRKELRPLRSLAKAASLMDSKLQVPPVEEAGSTELQTAVHAFNKMNRRVQSYIRDREMLFASISHDLKTPIACLRLRTEMLDDDATRERFERLLVELDLMVKGSLQCIRDTDILEEEELIDIDGLLSQAKEYFNRYQRQVEVSGSCLQGFKGKPLAIKRCIYNLLENGIKYGGKVDIDLIDNDDAIELVFVDYGKGIDPALLLKVFEPYFRDQKQTRSGTGLGLTIARSIARNHSGEVVLENHASYGLQAILRLPKC